MRRPETRLRAIADRMDLPQPERVRILEEISGDLEALRAELIRRGRPPAEAEEEAMRLLAPSDVALMELVSVHESLYRSLLRRFSSKLLAAEWIGLVGVTLVTLGIALGSLVRAGVLRSPSPFLWPVLAIAVALTTLAGRKAIRLYVEKDHEPRRLRSGLAALLVGSGAAVLLSAAGAVVETAVLAGRIEAAPDHQAALLLPWLMDTSVLVGAGLATALFGGLCWFLLMQKITAVEWADVRSAAAIDPFPPSTPLSPDQPLTS